MTTSAAFALSLFAIATLLVMLGLGIVAARAGRQRAMARRHAIVAPLRPALLRVLAEDDPDARSALLHDLLAMDARAWRALEPTVAQLLGKLRGDAHAVLREMAERQGTVKKARRRVRRPGAVGRARAAEVLGGLEDPTVTDDLISLLRDRDPEVRQVAARALGRCGDARSAQPLLDCIQRASVPPRVVSQALLRLGAGSQPAMVAALTGPDELVRAVAVEILGLSGAVGAARGVERCLREDPSEEVRIRAARALGKVGTRSSFAALIEATDERHSVGLRAVAARALGDLGHAAAIPTLQALLHDPVHRVASNAARALGALGHVGLDALQDVVDEQQGGLGGAHAAEALGRASLGRGARAGLPAGPAASLGKGA